MACRGFSFGSRTLMRRRAAPGAAWGVLLIGALVLSPYYLVAGNPLTKPEVLKLVRKNVQERRLVAVVRELGIDFKITTEVANELREAGASLSLIAALQGLAGSEPAEPAAAPTPPPFTPPPAPPAPATASEPPSPAAAAGDRAPVEPAPATTLEPPAAPADPPPPAYSRAAVETMVALIPGPPPPPPPPVIGPGPVSGVLESSAPPPPAAPPTSPATPPPPAPVPVAALAPPPEPPSRWEQVRPLLDKAQTLAAEGDVRGAQMLVVKAMELDPVEPQVWKAFKGIEQDLLARAETFLADGQLPRALREFQFIITTNPESALGHNGVGLALLQLKNYDEAVVAFERALALEPGNARYRQAVTRARSLQRASKALERQGQQNLKEMIEDQSGKKKGP